MFQSELESRRLIVFVFFFDLVFVPFEIDDLEDLDFMQYETSSSRQAITCSVCVCVFQFKICKCIKNKENNNQCKNILRESVRMYYINLSWETIVPSKKETHTHMHRTDRHLLTHLIIRYNCDTILWIWKKIA